MISVTIFVNTLFVYVTKIICILPSPNWICLGHEAIITIWIGGAVTVMIKKVFLFEMTTVILGVLSLRLSMNVINIVVVVDS